jgi:hypothetical protein
LQHGTKAGPKSISFIGQGSLEFPAIQVRDHDRGLVTNSLTVCGLTGVKQALQCSGASPEFIILQEAIVQGRSEHA